MPNLKKEELYELMKNFLGYGNTEGQYYFIGQEENWGKINWDTEITLTDQQFNYYQSTIYKNDEYLLKLFVERLTGIGQTFEKGIKEIFTIIRKEKEINAEDILDNSFVTNINFLPLENVYDFFEKGKYDKDKDERINKVKEFINKSEKNIFILCPKYYRDSIKLLSRREEKPNEFWNMGIVNDQRNKFYFLYHPSARNGLFEKRLKLIVSGSSGKL